jgi:hypothetical protein
MKKDCFKDRITVKEQESVIDSILAEWRDEVQKSGEENLKRKFYLLQDYFVEFSSELARQEII